MQPQGQVMPGSAIAALDRMIERGQIAGGPPRVRLPAMIDHPLERLVDRGLIDRRQFMAGVILRRDWEWCSCDGRPKLIANLTGVGGGGSIWELEPFDLMEAYGRWRWVITRLKHEHWTVLHAVCFLGDAPSSWATEQGIRRAEGLPLLASALSALAQILDDFNAEGVPLKSA